MRLSYFTSYHLAPTFTLLNNAMLLEVCDIKVMCWRPGHRLYSPRPLNKGNLPSGSLKTWSWGVRRECFGMWAIF